MAQNAAVVIDTTTGQALMVVVVEDDSELSDPAYNPPNSTQVLVPMSTFQISTPEQLQAIVTQALAQLGITPLASAPDAAAQ